MTLQQIHYAITIAELGSMNKAAEVLYIAQPSLTNAIKELEKELDLLIFHRGGRGVRLTVEGTEFLSYAKQLYDHYEKIGERFGSGQVRKKRFGVSTQHYSFAVQAFIEMVKRYDTAEYEFAIRETQTREVISDVSSLKSEIGLLYQSDFNRSALQKLFSNAKLRFTPLISCEPFVYLWRGHPLADEAAISFAQLRDYPCLSFEQGETASFYFAEEILSTEDYPRTIKANDRATMLNLMVGVLGYTLCSGIISQAQSNSDFLAVPFAPDGNSPSRTMEIGYLIRKDFALSEMAKVYLEELTRYIQQNKG